jgi:hypothetical protein
VVIGDEEGGFDRLIAVLLDAALIWLTPPENGARSLGVEFELELGCEVWDLPREAVVGCRYDGIGGELSICPAACDGAAGNWVAGDEAAGDEVASRVAGGGDEIEVDELDVVLAWVLMIPLRCGGGADEPRADMMAQRDVSMLRTMMQDCVRYLRSEGSDTGVVDSWELQRGCDEMSLWALQKFKTSGWC